MRPRARLLAGAALLALIAAWALHAGLRPQGVLTTLTRIRATDVVVALAAVLAGYALRTTRWHQYVLYAGGRTTWTQSGRIFLAGLLMGITPARIGEAVKAHALAREHGIPYTRGLALVIAERLLDVSVLALLLAIGLFATGLAPGVGAMVALAAVALLAFVASPRLARAAFATLARWERARKTAEWMERTHEEMRPLLRGHRLASALALTLPAWALEILATLVLADGLGLDLSAPVATLAFAVGALSGVAALLPGGLGVAEGGIAGIAAMAGAPPEAAAALALALRGATLWFGVALGAIAWIATASHDRRTLRKPQGAEATPRDL